MSSATQYPSLYAATLHGQRPIHSSPPLVTVAPASEPITAAELSLPLGLTTSDRDGYLRGLISTARAYIESIYNVACLPQTIEWALDAFPTAFARYEQYGYSGQLWGDEPIELPRPPLVAITSIQYVDSATGGTLTMSPSTYSVDVRSRPGRVAPVYGLNWPSARAQIASVIITYTAGYASAAVLPPGIKQAILALSLWLHEHPDEPMDTNVQRSIWSVLKFAHGFARVG